MRDNVHIRCFIIAVVCSLVFTWTSSGAKTLPADFITAKSAILIDEATGEILYQKAPDRTLPPASTTKVMTALVALEQKPKDTMMRVSKGATTVTPCKINVRAGERWRLEDLLRSILLNSANDASVVIAEAIAGSVPNFAALMNRKAAEIGARHTRFANPHGLDQMGHYTTARDMALIFQHAIKDPLFCDIAGTKRMCITGPSAQRIYLKNHNRLLDQYHGMLYGKTGYTSKAQRCFVGKATRNGRELIVCLLGSRNHFLDAARLLDFGFQSATEPDQILLRAAALPANVSRPQGSAFGGYVLQAASFSDSDKAADLHAALLVRGYPSFVETACLRNNTTWHRVRIGYYSDLQAAQEARAQIQKDFNIDPLVLR